MTVRAYPWHALDVVKRADAEAFRDVRRATATLVDLSRLHVVLSELLGARIDVVIRRAERASDVRPLAGGAAVAFADAAAPHLGRAILLEADGPLVANLTARVLKRSPPRVSDPGAPLPPAAAGVLAAIVAAAVRRAHEGSALRIVAAGPAAALELDLARLAPERTAVTLTVLVADEAFEARVVLPSGALAAARERRWDTSSVRALGGVPLAMPVVACTIAARAGDVGALGRGDVLVLPGWPLDRMTGRVWLAAPASTLGIAADLGETGRLVLRGEVSPLCAAAEAEMSDATESGGIIEAVGDVPVVVRVEIGEATMLAREWAALGQGDVIALGRRLGERVTLRIGGVPVARGDLVELDGEVGVRVMERLRQEDAV